MVALKFLKSTRMFPLRISRVVAGVPMIVIGCRIERPGITMCRSGRYIVEKGGAVLIFR